MKNMNTNPVGKENKPECQCVCKTPEAEKKHTGKAMMKTIKHGAQEAASDAVILGGELKDATKEMVSAAIKGSKAMCASSEKAVLEATDKALRVTSDATAKASKSVRKTINSKEDEKE